MACLRAGAAAPSSMPSARTRRALAPAPALLQLLLPPLLLALLATRPASAGYVSLSFQVEPQREDCFMQDVPAGAEVDAQVVVYRGGKLDVKLRVENPAKVVTFERLLFSNIDDRTGALLSTIVRKGTTFRAEQAGVYTVCLDNRMARWTAKVVTLDLDVRDPNDVMAKAEREAREARDAALLAGTEVDARVAFTLMRASAARIHSKLQQIEGAQLFHFHREQRHRNTVDSTDSRVHWWSVGETVVVVLSALLQLAVVVFGFFGELPCRRGGGMGGMGSSPRKPGGGGGGGMGGGTPGSAAKRGFGA
jgi:hypothetical protein